MELGDRLRRGGVHRGLEDHAELNVVVARIDLLPGQEAVERRVFRHALDIGGEKYMRHAEIRITLLALFADVALHGGDFNGLADKIGRPAARRHDIIGYDRHRVKRTQLAAVGTVAPSGVVHAIEIDLRAEQRQNPGKQEQHIRQNLPQLGPVLLREFLFVHADQNAERSEQQQKQRDRALDVAGDGHGVERGEGEIGDPEHERQPQIR